MAMVLQLTTFLQQYIYAQAEEIKVKNRGALKMGILSTAMINTGAVINPVKTHPDVVIHAVASRNKGNAETFAKKYDIPKAYGSYEELLQDPEIDMIYNPLPNAMHYEWSKKALEHGKHVLLEKPFTANADEARKLVALAVEKRLILVEAFHWQFHPAAHEYARIINAPERGRLLRTYSSMTTPVGTIPKSDIRYKFDLAGGSLMDMTYVISSARYAVGGGVPKYIKFAKAKRASDDDRVDTQMHAVLVFDKDGHEVESEILTDMEEPYLYGLVPQVWHLPTVQAEFESGDVVSFFNHMMPHVYHHISITDKEGRTTYEKHYTGGKWGDRGHPSWSTYRWQLEAFVDMVRGRTPPHWIDLQNSIDQMQTIDEVYMKAGLPVRPGTA